jgi:hypothetical protein
LAQKNSSKENGDLIDDESEVPMKTKQGHLRKSGPATLIVPALVALLVSGPAWAVKEDAGNPTAYTCTAVLEDGESMIESAKLRCKAGDQMMVLGLTDDEAASNVIRLICDLRYEVFIDRRKVIACIYRPLKNRPQ